MTAALISVPEAEAFIKAGGSARPGDLAALPAYIATASAVVEALAGPVVYEVRTFTKYLSGTLTNLVLPAAPATALSVTVDDVAQSGSAWTEDPTPGIVHGVFGPGTVVVEYSVGSTDPVPENIKMACKEQVLFLWQTSRNGATRDMTDVTYVGAGYAVPNKVRDLVAATHHRAPGFA